MMLTIGQWQSLFKIDGIDIVDELNWKPYALAEGLANDDTIVELTTTQIAKLSPLPANEIDKIIADH